MKAISAIVSGDSAAKDKAFAEGLFIAGERYVMARAEDRSIYARSVSIFLMPDAVSPIRHISSFDKTNCG